MATPGERAQLLRGFVRVIVAISGACSIGWALFTYPTFRHEIAFAAAAQHILSGEQYSPEQLKRLRSELDASSANSVRPSVLNDIAVIRLKLVEADLAQGQASAADLDALQRSIDAALDRNPTRSFLWLADYWLHQKRSGSADLGLLQMSYETGPNEGWIAAKRNPVALGVFSSLSEETRSRVVAEFAGLVRSRLYQDAANILTGAGWPVHQRLLDGLASLDEGHRRRFAKLLETRDIEDADVPGVTRRTFRPY
jgi:hypothetical protein